MVNHCAVLTPAIIFCRLKRVETEIGIQTKGMIKHLENLRETEKGSGIKTEGKMKHLERYVPHCLLMFNKLFLQIICILKDHS